MGIRIQEVKVLPESLMKKNLQCAANVYNQYVDCDILVVYSKIMDFCSMPCSIFLIMKKKIGVEKYDHLVYEKTKNIFSKIKFPDTIKNKIDSTYIKSEIDAY